MGNPDHIAHGTPAAAREFAAESLALAAFYADHAAAYAEIGDDTGLEYATRCLLSYVRQATATVRDIRSAGPRPEAAP